MFYNHYPYVPETEQETNVAVSAQKSAFLMVVSFAFSFCKCFLLLDQLRKIPDLENSMNCITLALSGWWRWDEKISRDFTVKRFRLETLEPTAWSVADNLVSATWTSLGSAFFTPKMKKNSSSILEAIIRWLKLVKYSE